MIEQSTDRTELEGHGSYKRPKVISKLHGTDREWGRIKSGEIGYTNRGVPPPQGRVTVGVSFSLDHKFVRIPRLCGCTEVRWIRNFFGKVGEEPQRQDIVAPSLRSEIFLGSYLKEGSRSGHCKAR